MTDHAFEQRDHVHIGRSITTFFVTKNNVGIGFEMRSFRCNFSGVRRYIPSISARRCIPPVNVLTNPHIIIPDSSAINIVRTKTGQPDRTDLNTALAEVPGGSLTTMKATPGEPTSGINL